MSLLSFNVPEVGQPDKTQDPKIANAFTQILAWANGEVDSTNLSTSGAQPFLQMLTAGKRKINWGKSSVTFASAASAEKTVAHGLGATPLFFHAIAASIATQIPSTTAVAVSFNAEPDSTNLHLMFETVDGGITNNGLYFYWVALG